MKNILVTVLLSVSTLFAAAQNVEKLVKDGMLVYMKNKTDLSSALNNNPDDVDILYQKFQPNEYAEEYIMVQVEVFKNEKSTSGFGVLYKNAEGNYVASNYSVLDEAPCQNCKLEKIEVPSKSDPIATFLNRSTDGYFDKKIGYNLREVLFYFYD